MSTTTMETKRSGITITGRSGARPATFQRVRPRRTTTRCRVCGFTEVLTDEVLDQGAVLLAQCPHCDHRWTEPVLLRTAPAPAGEAFGAA